MVIGKGHSKKRRIRERYDSLILYQLAAVVTQLVSASVRPHLLVTAYTHGTTSFVLSSTLIGSSVTGPF
jgi:hypothetical protein